MSVGGDYGKVFHRIWTDPTFRQLDVRPQRLFVLLCTTPARNYAGVVPLTVSRWAASAADETPDLIRDSLKVLCGTTMVVADYDTEEVLVRSYMRWDGLWKQPNMIPNLAAHVLNTVSTSLRAVLISELSRIVPETDRNSRSSAKLRELLNELVGGLKVGSVEGLSETSGEGLFSDSREGPVIVPVPVTAPVISSKKNCRPTMSITELATGKPETPPDVPPPDRAVIPAVSNGHRRTAEKIVRAILPEEQLRVGAVRTELTNQICAMLVKGVDQTDVEAGLTDWCSKALHPKVLPSLVSDAIKARTGHLGSKQGGKTTEKIHGWLNAGREIPE